MIDPGVYPDIPFSEYLALDAVSNSFMGRFADCPAKALIPRNDTPSLLFGRAVHTLVLEGEAAFVERYVKTPKVDRRTKEGKATWAEFTKKHSVYSDKIEILTEEDWSRCLAIGEAVNSHPLAANILANPATEQTVIWTDKDTGLLCKARPDILPGRDTLVLADLKTTRDAGENAFTRAVVNYGYARQMAYYTDGYAAATQVYLDSAIIIAVETEPPYRVEPYLLDDEFISYGREEYKRLLRQVAECKEKGNWPNYNMDNWKAHGGLTPLYKPAWI